MIKALIGKNDEWNSLCYYKLALCSALLVGVWYRMLVAFVISQTNAIRVFIFEKKNFQTNLVHRIIPY